MAAENKEIRNDPQEEIELITYDPRALIEFVSEKGFITSRDLEKNFGYSPKATMWIISDLVMSSFITSSGDHEYEFLEEEGVVLRSYHLSKLAREMTDFPKPRKVLLKGLPVSDLTVEVLNELIRNTQDRGLSLDEFKQINPSERKKMVDEASLTVLGDLSPDELRQYAEAFRKLKNFFGR